MSEVSNLSQASLPLVEESEHDFNQTRAASSPLTDAERHQMLVEWNATWAPYPQDQCFHQLFEQQAARTPEAVAVVCEGRKLTYEELNKRANQLARHLRRLGVGPEVLVGLCLERSLELLVGLLGIHKAGGAYVPLDPTYPQERLAFILHDAQVPLLVTQAPLLHLLPPHSARVVCLDTDWETIAQESAANPESGVTVDNLAYIIYTSGSTGQPKGVMLAHRGLANLTEVEFQAFHPGPASRVLQLASFSFDASLWDVLMALPFGGTLYLATGEARMPGPALGKLLQDQAITIATLTPSMLAALPADELPALQTVISMGETCTADLVTRWAGTRRFLNGYGPTETTVGATLAECAADGQTPPIGRPFLNTQVYVLDTEMQPVPVGVAGEMYVGGVGLARGYLNRPELTAQRFIPNPFSQEPGARLYKTGDLARYRPDGNLEYVGRVDFQVKIRGFRIELGEIETLLVQHPQVREAVVLAREDTPGEKRLVAYLVPAAEQPPTSSALRAFLKERLPYYMIPAFFVALEAFPLNANGKVDRRALPAPEGISKHLAETFVAPRTPTEELLAEIWRELLGLELVGIDDNFFDLGGHSFLAERVLVRVQEVFQVELPQTGLFELPTIRELAEEIKQLLIAKIEMMSDEEVQRLLG